MNLIAKLLPPSNVLLDLDVTSKKRMFEQAGLLFENNQGVARSLVFDSLFARERLGSTGLGQGLAIPHSRNTRLTGLPSGASNGTGCARRTKAPTASFRPLILPCGIASPCPSNTCA